MDHPKAPPRRRRCPVVVCFLIEAARRAGAASRRIGSSARRIGAAARIGLEAARPAGEAVLAALFPADCLVCAKPLPWRQRGGVCLPCWDRLPWETGWRPVTGAPIVLYWAAPYQGPIRDLIHDLKFTGMDTLGGPLGDALAVRLGPVLPPADLVTFVPLHRWRRFRRGFNQAEEIARTMGRRLGLPCEALLERHRIEPGMFKSEEG